MAQTSNECKNCCTELVGTYCHNCGQKADQKRYTLTNLPQEFLHGFFHIHGGLLYTIKELFIHPGVTLRGYIAGKRINYFNPFTYLVIISLAGGFMYASSGITEHINDNFLASGKTIFFTREHFSIRILLNVPAYALLSWIMFRSYKYNLAEHLIINTFLMSQSIFFMVVGMIVISIVKSNDIFSVLYSGSFILFMIYQVLAYFHLFNTGNKVLRWLKASVVVVTGLGLSFFILNGLAKLFFS